MTTDFHIFLLNVFKPIVIRIFHVHDIFLILSVQRNCILEFLPELYLISIVVFVTLQLNNIFILFLYIFKPIFTPQLEKQAQKLL